MLDEAVFAAATLSTMAGTWWSIRRIARTPAPVAPEPYRLDYTVDWPKEPWRYGPDPDTITPLPTWWLRSIANRGELAAAARHDYRLDGLRNSIDELGIATPLAVNIDQLGRVCLADGHHRLVVATELDLAECPARIVTVPRIGGYGVAVGPAFAALLTGHPVAANRDRALSDR